MSEILTTVGKVVAPFLVRWIERVQLPRKIAGKIVQYAAADGLHIDRRVLTKCIRQTDLAALLVDENTGELGATIERIANLIELDGQVVNRTDLERWTTKASVEMLPPGPGNTVALTRLEKQLKSETRDVTESLASVDVARIQFDQNLSTFLPDWAWLARHIEQEGWEGIYRLVHAMREPAVRLKKLSEWRTAPGIYLREAPGDTYALLGKMASEYKLVEQATHYFDMALELGVSFRASVALERINYGHTLDQAAIRSMMETVSDHPLRTIVIAELDGDAEQVRSMVSLWNSDENEMSIFLAIKANLALVADDYAMAVESGTLGWRKYKSTRCAEAAIQAHINAWQARSDAGRFSELELARTIGYEMRDHKRLHLLPPGHVAALLAEVHIRMGDLETAAQVVSFPDGDASELEAADDQARLLAARLITRKIGPQEIQSMIENFDGGTTERLDLQASVFEMAGQPEAAIPIWKQILDSEITDDETRIHASMRLALLGVWNEPELKNRGAHDSEMEEIKLVAGLFSEQEGSLEVARSSSRTSRRVMYSLVRYYETKDMRGELLGFAESAARRFGDPDLWLLAARVHADRGAVESCREDVAEALTQGGSAWGGKYRARALLVEVLSARGDWVEAAREAEALAQISPDDPRTVWIVAICREHAGDTSGSYNYWASHMRPDPATPQEVTAWLVFYRRMGDEVASIEAVENVVDQFRASFDVRRLHLGLVLQGKVADPGSRKLTIQTFLDDFPGQKAIYVLTIDHADLLGSIERQIGPRPDYRPLDEAVDSGALPIGLSAALKSGFYSRSIADRSGMVRFLSRAEDMELSELATSSAVIDLSALRTLSLLGKDVQKVLLGQFATIFATAEQRRDCANALEEIFETAQDGLSDVLHLFDEVDVRSHPALSSSFSDLAEEDVGVWLSSADFALTSDRVFWCDDRAYASLANSFGLTVVSTADLLRRVRVSTSLTTPILDAATACLISERYVGFDFTQSAFRLSAIRSPAYTADALRNVNPTQRADVLSFVQTSLTGFASNTEVLDRWVWVVTSFFLDIDDDLNRVRLASGWLSFLLSREWIPAEVMPLVLNSSKMAAGTAWVNIFESAVAKVLHTLAEVHPPALAADFVRAATAFLTADDKSIVTEVTLLGRWGERAV